MRDSCHLYLLEHIHNAGVDMYGAKKPYRVILIQLLQLVLGARGLWPQTAQALGIFWEIYQDWK